jgi:hypothetical protein
MERDALNVGPCRVAFGDVAPELDGQLAEARVADLFDPGKGPEDIRFLKHASIFVGDPTRCSLTTVEQMF